jgi:hypothetical protein
MHPCPLAKAGGSKCKAEECPHPWNEVERAERSGGLHKRSAEDWGNGLCARGQCPLRRLRDRVLFRCSEDFCCLWMGFQRCQIRAVGLLALIKKRRFLNIWPSSFGKVAQNLRPRRMKAQCAFDVIDSRYRKGSPKKTREYCRHSRSCWLEICSTRFSLVVCSARRLPCVLRHKSAAAHSLLLPQMLPSLRQM